MTDRELMQKALDALEKTPRYGVNATTFQAIDALRVRLAQSEPEQVIQARREGKFIVVELPDVPRGGGGIRKDAQPEPEPVAWRYGAMLYQDKLDALEFMRTSGDGYKLEPLYTAPPRKEWQGLTDEERNGIINFIWMPLNKLESDVSATIARAIEAKLKEKNSASD